LNYLRNTGCWTTNSGI